MIGPKSPLKSALRTSYDAQRNPNLQGIGRGFTSVSRTRYLNVGSQRRKIVLHQVVAMVAGGVRW